MLDIEGRIAMTLSCRDCDPIAKVENAGAIVNSSAERAQIMHNGVMVTAGGYHGDWMERIITGLRGHHEPQEERIFDALLPHCRAKTLMVELGSFWSYYTLWYLQAVEGSSAICIEPDPINMEIGRRNAALNARTDRIRFVNAWIGEEAAVEHHALAESLQQSVALPLVDLPALLQIGHGREIELLHIDAQGAELGFLRSFNKASAEIRFVVVSTHHHLISGSTTTHADCIAAIQRNGGSVLFEHNVDESFSGDGLIVASFHPEDAKIMLPSITRNSAENSLFGVD